MMQSKGDNLEKNTINRPSIKRKKKPQNEKQNTLRK